MSVFKKNIGKLACGGAAVVLALSSAAQAGTTLGATTISDTYKGAGDNNDVWGSPGIYGIDRMELSLTGTTLTVDIYTAFAGNNGVAGGSGNTIYYGDLFMSSSWNPDGAATYDADHFNNTGTTWTHAVSLDDRDLAGAGGIDGDVVADNGDAGVYTIASPNALSSFVEDTDWYDNARSVDNAGVEIIAGLDDRAGSTRHGTGTYTTEAGYIQFIFDLAGTGLLDMDKAELALRWQQTCANDIIEGSVPLRHMSVVPVPSALPLGGLGLAVLGMGNWLKRRK